MPAESSQKKFLRFFYLADVIWSTVTQWIIQSLHNKRVLSIDLSAIMAGSGIRGQFEEKFKSLIRDIEDEVWVLNFDSRALWLTSFAVS